MLVPGASSRGDEVWGKQTELSCESDPLRRGSATCHASKKSSTHHKPSMPVPETDTGGEVEDTKGREITLSKELGKIAP